MKVTGSTIQQLEKDKPRSRCRKWRLWITAENGRKSRVFHGTYTQAQSALKAFVDEISEQVPNSDSFGSYALSWRLWREKSGEFAAGTIQNDKREVTALCRTQLSDMRMDEITPESCRESLLWLKTHPVRKDGELSNTTMNSLYICLNAIMQQAFDDGKIARNPMAKIKAPKPDTKEKESLSPDELMLLVNRLDELPIDGRVMALYFICLQGLRRGEACALADDDIVGRYAKISKAIKERSGKIDVPKTESGIRTIPIPGKLHAKIEEWKQIKRLLYGETETLCCNTQGGILRPQLLHRWWCGDSCHTGMRDTIGCSGITLHQLRHSNLSMMARHMSPFDLQRYAGWSSIEPAKVYIHEDLEKVTNAVNQAWQITTK